MPKYSVRDLSLSGARAFVRVDFNVPIKDGRITDDTRITASLPTIEHALKAGATVILASHLGRPKGKPAAEFSLAPVATRLSDLLKREVTFATDCIGEPARHAVTQCSCFERSRMVLLENLRFHRRGGKERRGVCQGARIARRRLRQRRIRRGASRACVGRGDRAALRHAGGRGSADGKGAALSRDGARAIRIGRSSRSSAAPRSRTRSR